ncbi:MAG: hypothetical protein J0I80_06230 [Sphingomonas sp.]|nr:hypothetical protein [Sphingomonas sp.]
MPIGAELDAALRAFAQTEREIVTLGERLTPETTTDFALLRRDLALCFARVGAALEADPFLKADAALLTQATRLLSAFRTQNAINQADWPVIRVRDDMAGYRQAVKTLVERSGDFWHWVAQRLGFDRRQV